jgi:DNA polymerase-3 subunit alpha/error-prone DNA polymerase
LIFIGAFRFTTKTKKSIARHRPLDISELQTREPELNVAQEPVKEYKLPVLERSPLKMP